MCGIIGISGIEGGSPLELVTAMKGTLHHRGPDDSGVWSSHDGSLALAHCRLAIIDLTSAGHQPMHFADNTLTIVFNGEIYNYKDLKENLLAKGYVFHSSSDTEVVLAAYHLWGERCAEHLNGMFAFAVYDARHDRLFLARDRAGEKPLYYMHAGTCFVFASELKALLKHPVVQHRLDLRAMNHFLTYGYIPRDMSILAGVNKLVQGHSMTLDRHANRLSVRPYWILPEYSHRNVRAEELVDELGSLLKDAIRRQMVADVPVGVLLSGGLDSSIITALASQVSSKPVKTFTVSFPGHSVYDESKYAHIVARHFGTDHTVLPAETVSYGLLPVLARQYDEPMADSSMIPTYLVSKLIRQHATVAVGGDGGDELFAGYHHYNWMIRQEMLRKYLPGFLRAAISLCARNILPTGFRGRNYLIGAEGPVDRSYAFVNHFFDSRMRTRLFEPLRDLSPQDREMPENYKGMLPAHGGSTLYRSTAVDFMTYLPDDILVKVDRASMLTSLEVRAPFLDYRIIEFAFSQVPDSLKLNGNRRKILPKMLAMKLLPAELDIERKQGFAIPLATWIKGDWGLYMKSVLLDGATSFNRKELEILFRNQERGMTNSQRIFALTMFELWRREYGVVW